MSDNHTVKRMALVIGVAAVLIVAWMFLPRSAKDSRFDFDAAGLRAPSEPAEAAMHSPALSALDPDAVERLRESITTAIARSGVENASAAVDTTVEYALGVGDDDIDRLLGLAIKHGGKPNEALVARFRFMADAQPDRGRPRDLASWNAVQVLRWATALTSTAKWVGVDFEGVSARPFVEADKEAFFDVTPTSPGVSVGIAPMKFPRPDLAERLNEGARGLVVTVPAVQANGDPLFAELLLVEYEPEAWYPLTARVAMRERPKMPERAPRPR